MPYYNRIGVSEGIDLKKQMFQKSVLFVITGVF